MKQTSPGFTWIDTTRHRRKQLTLDRLAQALAAAAVLVTGCSPERDDDPGASGDGSTPVAMAPSSDAAPAPTAGEESIEQADTHDDGVTSKGGEQDVIPARFHGDFSEDLAHCGTPGHQRYDIRAREVGFFESRGIVQDVKVNGDYAAITLSEQYGDAPPSIYTLYMAIEGPDTMRIRYDKEPRFRIYRCP